jgi:putative sterol carrier protein
MRSAIPYTEKLCYYCFAIRFALAGKKEDRKRSMATREELREALDDYVAQAQKSKRVVQALRNWNCTISIEATDIQATFTMIIKDNTATVHDDRQGQPDLIVRGSSEDLADIFWCDSNPASSYMQGVVKIQGSQDNVMRLDAMAALIYQEVNK